MLDDAIKPVSAVAASVLPWPMIAISLHLWGKYRRANLAPMKSMDSKRADDKMPDVFYLLWIGYNYQWIKSYET